MSIHEVTRNPFCVFEDTFQSHHQQCSTRSPILCPLKNFCLLSQCLVNPSCSCLFHKKSLQVSFSKYTQKYIFNFSCFSIDSFYPTAILLTSHQLFELAVHCPLLAPQPFRPGALHTVLTGYKIGRRQTSDFFLPLGIFL